MRASAIKPLAPKPPHFPAKAKNVIFLFMYGGPSHIDSFDYKPNMVGMDGKTIKVKVSKNDAASADVTLPPGAERLVPTS